MGGPFGGVIDTSEGLQAVAPDGTFWVPQGDVAAMLGRGAFFVSPGLASIRIGGYVIYEDNTALSLDVQTPDGVIVPFVVGDALESGNGPGLVVTKTANYSIQPADNQTTFDNGGAVSPVIFSLPSAAPGLEFSFIVLSLSVLEILAHSGDQITIGAQGSVLGGNAQSGIIHSYISLIAPRGVANLWVGRVSAGSWSLT